MAIDKITSKGVRGEFMRALQVAKPPAWVEAISNEFESDEASENYPWLSAAPVMREWIGGRLAKNFTETDWTVRNRHFETTIEVLVRDLRRDKLGALRTRISEVMTRAQSHNASLLSDLIVAGESSLCYDGQYFFDTDHEEGDSGTQSNDISVDISALPIATHGTVAAPAVAEMQLAITKGVKQITTFKDDVGEPMNETASQFVVMAPTLYSNTIEQALATPAQVAETQTVLQSLKASYNIVPVTNVRLDSDWTTKFAIFRIDSPIKALMRQKETNMRISAKAEGSEFEFDNDAHQYGIDIWKAVAYARWQNACLVTLT